MSILQMQRVLSKLVTDDNFLATFTREPARACRDFDLRPAELEALKKIDRVRLTHYSHMLHVSRVALALKAFPVTRSLLPHDFFENFVATYCQEVSPVPRAASAMFLEAVELAAFLLRKIEEGQVQVRYLHDALLYERNLFFLNNSPDIAILAREYAQRGAALLALHESDRLLMTVQLGDHAIVSEFEHDPQLLIPELARRAIPDLQPQKRSLLFLKVAGQIGVSINAINSGTARLLQLANGTRTLQEIIGELSGGDPAAQFEQRCHAIVEKLLRGGVITLNSGASL